MPPLRTYRWIAVLTLLGGGLLFGSTLIGRDRLAFRDVGHFYAPLYEHLGQRTAAWQLPLWNPLDHTGTPMIGETTTAMFYPPRWVFALPLPGSVAMGLYVVFHLLLAAGTAGWAASRGGCKGTARVFAALAYALSCPIVFLYCNPPFLVGAAWLPCALGLGLRLLESNDARTISAAAFVFAMPVLAGDPQTPLHIAVWIAIVWAGRQAVAWCRGGRCQRVEPPNRRILPWLLAVGGAVLIALPQVAGSWDWAQHSARRFQSPQGVYHFSVSPWQWLDLLVPTSNGPLFPQFQRISQLIPGDSRIWSVSLYGGVLTVLLCGWRYTKRQGLGAWELLAPLGMLMAMGKFGPVWWLQAVAGAMGADADGHLMQADPASWSPYWLLSHILPGYDSFRYPAKWLPFVSLGLAVTAGRQLQEHNLIERPPWRGLAAIAAALLLASLPLTLPASRDALLAQLPAGVWTDAYWGPLDRTAGLAHLASSLRHAGGVCAVAVGLLWYLHRKPARPQRYVVAMLCFCGLLVVDLVLVNMPLVATVERQQEAAWLADQRLAAGNRPSGQSLLRTGDEGPAVWRQTSVRTRVAEVAASERIGLQGRWHLPAGQRVFNSATSITPQRYASCAAASAGYTATLAWDQQERVWTQLAAHWDLTAYLHTSSQGIPASSLDGRPVRLMDTRWIPLAESSPELAWHPRWRTTARRVQVSQRDWLQHFEAIFDPTTTALPVVEVLEEPRVAPEVGATVEAETLDAAETLGVAEVEVSERDAESLRATVRCERSGLLSRWTFQDGHWHCRYRPLRADSEPSAAWTAAEVCAVDYLGQGVLLPAGQWEVEFWYRPWWLTPSLLVSVMALMVVVRSANITGKR